MNPRNDPCRIQRIPDSRTDLQDQATLDYTPLASPLAQSHGPLEIDSTAYGSDVEVLDLECVFLDELAARFNIVAHEGGEQVVGGSGILEPDLKQVYGALGPWWSPKAVRHPSRPAL